MWFWMGVPSSHGYYGEGTIEAMPATSSYIYHHGSENHIFVVSLSLLVRGLVVMVLESQILNGMRISSSSSRFA
jgi:hypothetical protein